MNKSGPAPLPARLAGLVREAKWLLLGALALYLLLVLVTYHRGDPGWSHTGSDAVARNAGGALGAWLADIFLYLFGLSAYWLVALCASAVLWGYRRFDARSAGLALGGFGLLLLSSASLEGLRLHSLALELPLAPGGLVGDVIGGALAVALGFTGATLALVALAAVGLSLFAGVSWLTVSEFVGFALESACVLARRAWERRQDRRLGELAREERELVVEAEKKREENHPPLRIEPPVVEIKKSERVHKEKQARLFEELPDTPLPPLKLLDEAKAEGERVSPETIEFTSRLIEKKLSDFGVAVKVLAAYPGPVITRYEIEPAVGVKGSQIVNLVKDLARALSVVSIRVVETIPGKSCMGLEIPNPHRQTVRLSEILGSEAYHALHSPLALALGKDIAGNPVVADLARMPHLLVAGTTGSGKSVALNAMILSLLYKSELRHVRLILIDPKMLELSVYQDIPHLLAPVVTDMKQATNALGWCVAEMDRRYKLMNWLGVRNLSGFNHKVAEAEKQGRKLEDPFTLDSGEAQALNALPHIVLVIDELADLMMVIGKKVEELIARLAQKARAAGIHLVLATQRPSVDVITGMIKANVPSRIAFAVSSQTDSRVILDQAGAESLLGQGDMLFKPLGTSRLQRLQGAFVTEEEIALIVEQCRGQREQELDETLLEPPEGAAGEDGAEPGEFDPDEDPLLEKAIEVVVQTQTASVSLIQRRLRVGYTRAGRLIDMLERRGIISGYEGSKPRRVLVTEADFDRVQAN